MTEQIRPGQAGANSSAAAKLVQYFAEQADDAMRSGDDGLADHLIGLAYRALDGHFGSVVVPFGSPKRRLSVPAVEDMANAPMVALPLESVLADPSVVA